jgi:hypothetical protein
MLRPACLLPTAQLSSLHGLLTPRSGTEDSLAYLGPASRRTDAYRRGTLTRWKSAACSERVASCRSRITRYFTTHHAGIVARTQNLARRPAFSHNWDAPPEVVAEPDTLLQLSGGA